MKKYSEKNSKKEEGGQQIKDLEEKKEKLLALPPIFPRNNYVYSVSIRFDPFFSPHEQNYYVNIHIVYEVDLINFSIKYQSADDPKSG